MNEYDFDHALKSLGRGTPFEVDWDAYERKLTARLLEAQTKQSRRTWRAALGGAVAGAAAMFVVTMQLSAPVAVPVVAAAPVVPKVEAVLPEVGDEEETLVFRAKGKSRMALTDAPDYSELEPFAKYIRLQNGRFGEIRFDGFNDEAAGEGEIVAVVE